MIKNPLISLALTLCLVSCEKPSAGPAAAAPAAPPGAPPAPAAAAPALVPPAAPPAPAPAADPKAVFTAALNAVADEVNALEKKHKDTNPMELMKQLPGLLKKLESVSTAGLPEDLAAAFTRVQKNASATADLIASVPAELPADPDKIPDWLQAHPEVMKIMLEMDAKMTPIKAEGEVAKKALEAAAAKHGLDLSRFIKAGEPREGE